MVHGDVCRRNHGLPNRAAVAEIPEMFYRCRSLPALSAQASCTRGTGTLSVAVTLVSPGPRYLDLAALHLSGRGEQSQPQVFG